MFINIMKAKDDFIDAPSPTEKKGLNGAYTRLGLNQNEDWWH